MKLLLRDLAKIHENIKNLKNSPLHKNNQDKFTQNVNDLISLLQEIEKRAKTELEYWTDKVKVSDPDLEIVSKIKDFTVEGHFIEYVLLRNGKKATYERSTSELISLFPANTIIKSVYIIKRYILYHLIVNNETHGIYSVSEKGRMGIVTHTFKWIYTVIFDDTNKPYVVGCHNWIVGEDKNFQTQAQLGIFEFGEPFGNLKQFGKWLRFLEKSEDVSRRPMPRIATEFKFQGNILKIFWKYDVRDPRSCLEKHMNQSGRIISEEEYSAWGN
tara:strand:+ start:938 stop:1753 length:816 start_codon:yes stop_codon:yes gene_type:complete